MLREEEKTTKRTNPCRLGCQLCLNL